MDPMLDMANRVASLPWAMHQSLEGEGYAEIMDKFSSHKRARHAARRFLFGARSIRNARLRERVRAALLEDWPVSGVERLEAAVERVCRAVEGEA